MKTLNLLALDNGASNGRGILGRFDGKKISLSEVYRYENSYMQKGNMLYWDSDALFNNMQKCISECAGKAEAIHAFGIDTWGVDFGLLDKEGELINWPRCYRHAAEEDSETVWEKVPKRTLFKRTGTASLNFNTVYQLFKRVRENDPELAAAQTLLLMPDLFGYLFTGEKASEFTNVSTMMMYNPLLKDWDWETIEALDIPKRIFTNIDHPGTIRGKLKKTISDELGISQIPFAVVGTHDTASAVAAIPGSGSFAFLSSGTWSLFGMETDTPCINDTVFHANFSNEGTVQGGFRPLKNIMGLWIIQECRKEWLKNDKALTWDDIVDAADKSEPFRSVIDPDDDAFFRTGLMSGRIQNYCAVKKQPVPETIGQIARCIYESLALKYHWAFEQLEKIKGRRIDSLNIVGGGIQNKLLDKLAADSINRNVITGPIEGTSMGNLLMQAVALGEIKDIREAREVVRLSAQTDVYEPHHTPAWDDAYERLLKLMEK